MVNRSHSELRGYVARWLAKHPSIANDNLASPARFQGLRDTGIHLQEEFQQLGDLLVERWRSEHLRVPPTVFAILKTERRAAYAVAPADCDAVFVTNGFVERVQQACGQAKHLLSCLGDSSNELSRLWNGLPLQREYVEAFGALIAHVAFSFIVHHELAHLGLAHEKVWKNYARFPLSDSEARLPDDLGTVLFSEDDAAGLPPCAGAPEAVGYIHPNQPLEVDADVNALHFTRQYLADAARVFATLPNSTAIEPLDNVWQKFLSSPRGLRYVLAVGACAGLLALAADTEPEGLAKMRTSSHPPIPARLLLLLHVEERTVATSAEPPLMAEALAVSLSIFAALHQANAAVTAVQEHGSLNNFQTLSTNDVFLKFGIHDAMKWFDSIGLHFQEVSRMFAATAPSLRRDQRLHGDARIDWF